MENELVPNNTTLAQLRRLRKAFKEIVGDEEAVHIDLSLWHYDNSVRQSRIKEEIGVYHSRGGPTEYFQSLPEAYKYLEKIRKEKKDANTSESVA